MVLNTNRIKSISGQVGWPAAGFLAIFILRYVLFQGKSSIPQFSSPNPEMSASGLVQTTLVSKGLEWNVIENMFVFGDSYSSTWFDLEGEQPSAENPLGNEAIGHPDDVLTTDPNWVRYVAEIYNQSNILVRNIAVGSTDAYVDRQEFDAKLQGIVWRHFETLQEQIDDRFGPNYVPLPVDRGWWEGYTREANRSTWLQASAHSPLYDNTDQPSAPTTMAAVWFGIRDIISAHARDVALPTSSLFASYSASLERLHESGLRNFLLINVPPIDRGMGDRDGRIRQRVHMFNSHLELLREKFAARHARDTRVWVFDANALFVDVMDDHMAFGPAAQGLRNLTGWCEAYRNATELDAFVEECGVRRGEYFWRDETHVMYTVHNITAERIVRDCFGGEGPRDYCS